jgi:hypothetical protein
MDARQRGRPKAVPSAQKRVHSEENHPNRKDLHPQSENLTHRARIPPTERKFHPQNVKNRKISTLIVKIPPTKHQFSMIFILTLHISPKGNIKNTTIFKSNTFNFTQREYQKYNHFQIKPVQSHPTRELSFFDGFSFSNVSK